MPSVTSMGQQLTTERGVLPGPVVVINRGTTRSVLTLLPSAGVAGATLGLGGERLCFRLVPASLLSKPPAPAVEWAPPA